MNYCLVYIFLCHVHVYTNIGDLIRFGASTRLYLLNGPDEFSRANINNTLSTIKTSSNTITPTTTTQETNDSSSNPEQKNKTSQQPQQDTGVSWGIQMNDLEDQEQSNTLSNNNNNDNQDEIPIESMTIPPKAQKLHERYRKKMYKLANLQQETQRIQAKSYTTSLSAGQQAQLEKNEKREADLMEEIHNLETELRERIQQGSSSNNNKDDSQKSTKRKKKSRERYDEDDVDDFYDRTKSSTIKKVKVSDEIKDAKTSVNDESEATSSARLMPPPPPMMRK